MYLTAHILSVRAATRPVRRLVRWGQQYLLGTGGRNNSSGVCATATSNGPRPSWSKTIATHSTNGPITQPSGSCDTVGKDSVTSATKGCHHSINTSTNTYKNDPPAYNREDLPGTSSSTSKVAKDVPRPEPTRGVVPSRTEACVRPVVPR